MMLPRKNREILDGYEYDFNKENHQGTRYYACSQLKSRECPGWMNITVDGSKKMMRMHNHSKIMNLDRLLFFREALRQAAAAETSTLKEIWDRFEREYPEIAVNTSYLAERNGMNHVRIKVQGKGYKGVKSLNDFASFLELKADVEDLFSHKLKDGSARTLDSRVVTDKNGNIHVILYNRQLLHELKDGKKCHIDATFGSRPKLIGCSQLLSILVRMFGKAYPCMWVFMSSKAEVAYEAVFAEIKKLWPEWSPEEFHSDFEQGLMNAIETVFGSVVIGCFFHYTQALFRNAVDRGAAQRRNAINHPDKHFILLKVMALALLQAEKIEKQFLKIKQEAHEKFNSYFDEFFDYYESYWLNKRGVSSFCVFGQVNRTNNVIESYHRDLHQKTKHIRPTVWKIISILVGYVDNLLIDLHRQKTRFPDVKKKKFSVINDNNIKKWWKELQAEKISPDIFLNKAATDLLNGNKIKTVEEEIQREVEQENCEKKDGKELENTVKSRVLRKNVKKNKKGKMVIQETNLKEKSAQESSISRHGRKRKLKIDSDFLYAPPASKREKTKKKPLKERNA